MTAALYVLGAPGVGKSTFVKAYLQANAWTALPEPTRLHRTLIGHYLADRTGEVTGVYLGKHRQQFPGTDALSMAVAPDARVWARNLEPWLGFIVGEGQRLGNAGFLRALGENTELTVVLLVADEAVLDARCEERGSAQAPGWRRGAAKGAANAFRDAQQYASAVVVLDANQPTAELVSVL
jgi:hypothetical protein